MKKVITLALLSIFLALPIAAQEAPGPKVYFGFSFDQDKALTVNAGSAQNLVGGLWMLEHANVGNYGALDANLAYFFKASDKFAVGVVAGPGAEFSGQDDPITYITGGSGLILFYEWDILGLYAAGRYNFALDNNAEFYIDGWTASAGFSLDFGG